VDAVIRLPANIFYGTSIPTCIPGVEKKCEISEDVYLLMQCLFEKVKNQVFAG